MGKKSHPDHPGKDRPLEVLLAAHAKGWRLPWWEFIRVRGYFQAKRERERAERGAGGPPRPLVAKLTKGGPSSHAL